jgi:hypothetical protein
MWLLVGLGVLGVGMAAGGTAVVNAVSLAEKANADGICPTDPATIARAHGVTLDAEALARMGVSEASGRQARVAVMAAAINEARRRGESIAALLLRGRNKNGSVSASDGRFAGQNTGKYASTRSPSTAETRVDAQGLLSGKIGDPTNGANQWFAAAAQDALVKKGTAGYTKTSAEILASRSKTSDVVTVSGVSSIQFFRPKGAA